MCLWDPNLIPPLQLAIWHSQNPSKSQGPSSFSPIFDGHNMIDCKNALRPSRGYLPGVIPHPWPFCSQHRPAEGRSPRASNCGNGSLGWLDMVEGPVAMFFYWSSGVKRNEKNTFPLFRKTHQTDESSPVTARRKNCKTTIWETKKHATNRRELRFPWFWRWPSKLFFFQDELLQQGPALPHGGSLTPRKACVLFWKTFQSPRGFTLVLAAKTAEI